MVRSAPLRAWRTMLRIAARTVQAPLMHLGFDPSRRRASAAPQDEGRVSFCRCVGKARRARNIPAQTKKDQLALALLVVRTDPILTTPGGWGLRNPEPKGPGQRTQVFSQRRAAVAWRKSGDTMIPSNDPVTVCRDRVPPLRVPGSAPDFMTPFMGPLRWGTVGAIMQLS
jgi:hypothetical protein